MLFTIDALEGPGHLSERLEESPSLDRRVKRIGHQLSPLRELGVHVQVVALQVLLVPAVWLSQDL